MRGTISNLLIDKNYGFIRGENSQQYFFHLKDLNGNWKQLCIDWCDPGITQFNVAFDPVSTPKGPRANNVNLIQQT